MNVIYVEAERTADFQLTKSINHIIENGANKDDILALFEERNLPVDDITASNFGG